MMTPKKRRFVEEYLVDLNATKAAERAGYSVRSAKAAGCRLLTDVDVAALLEKAQSARSQKTGITADRVLRELALIGFSDLRGLFTSDGKLKAVHGLEEDIARAVASVDVTKERTIRNGDSTEQEFVSKVKVWDKVKALELIGRHLAMWKDRVELETPEPFRIELTDYAAPPPHPKPAVPE